MTTNELVLDIETQKTFQEVGGKDKIHLLKISLVGVYSYPEDNFFAYEEKDIWRLETLLRRASRVIGFNIKNFDWPVLKPYLFFNPADIPTLDIFEDVEKATGNRISLNNISKATLNMEKSGHGLEAIDFFRKGEMEKLKKYCLDDVRLTRDLYEFGKKNNEIFYLDQKSGKNQSIKVDWTKNFSLNFNQEKQARLF